MPAFLPSSQFNGARRGYVFQAGPLGTGYYPDPADPAAAKRGRDDEDGAAPVAKRARRAVSAADAAAEERANRLLAEAERAAAARDGGALASGAAAVTDEAGLARALRTLAKTVRTNRELRVRYPDKPAKFMESELSLDGQLRALSSVASEPTLYPTLAHEGAAELLLSLLAHENTDVAVDAVALLNDLTAADVLTAVDPETTRGFLQALLDAGYVPYLCQNLRRLDELSSSKSGGGVGGVGGSGRNNDDGDGSEELEARGVHNTLGIFESLLDVRPDLAVPLCKEGLLLPWLLHRINNKAFDANKLYASEILAILMQNPVPRAVLVEDVAGSGAGGGDDGIDLLLRAVHIYRKTNPSDAAEEECIENVFSALCGALAGEAKARTLFRTNQGVALCMRVLKAKRFAFRGALRILSHAAQGEPATCAQIVEQGGLKVLFPAFMGVGKIIVGKKKKKNRGGAAANGVSEMEDKVVNAIRHEEEEVVVTLLASLIMQLSARGGPASSSSSSSGYLHLIPLKRVLRKFRERSFEKVDRLVELHEKYFARVAAAEQAHFAGAPAADEDEDEVLLDLRRRDAGLPALQAVALVIATLCAHSPALREYTVGKLQEEEGSQGCAQVLNVLAELVEEAGVVDEDEGEGEAEESGGRMLTLAHRQFRAVVAVAAGTVLTK